MAKDPICGMDVAEEGAQHTLHFAHETIYFCSKTCRETYARQAGMLEPAAKGVFRRFLEKLAKGNEDYGGHPPKCH